MQSSRVACQKQLLHSNFRPVPKSLFLAERSSRCCRLYMKKESKSSLGYLGCCESSSLHWLHWFWYLDIPNKSGLWMIIPLCFLVDSMSPSSKSLYISLKTTDIDLPVLARVEGDANIYKYQISLKYLFTIVYRTYACNISRQYLLLLSRI